MVQISSWNKSKTKKKHTQKRVRTNTSQPSQTIWVICARERVRDGYKNFEENQSSNTSSSWYGKWCMLLYVFNFSFAYSPVENQTEKKYAKKCVVLQRECLCEYFISLIYFFVFPRSPSFLSYVKSSRHRAAKQNEKIRNNQELESILNSLARMFIYKIKQSGNNYKHSHIDCM